METIMNFWKLVLKYFVTVIVSVNICHIFHSKNIPGMYSSLSPVYLGMINATKKPQSIDIDKSFPLTSIKQEINPVQGPGQGFYS